jgi:hypothetical protein
MQVRILVAALAGTLWIGCGSSGGGTGGTGGVHHDAAAGTGGTDAVVAVCDPATQTGCSDPNPKCAVTFPDPQGGGVIMCEPAGTVQPSGTCVRQTDSNGNDLPGIDNCTNGYCTAFGASSGRQCSRYCDESTSATNCTSSQACFTQATAPDGHQYGLCRKTCDPFGAASQCPQTNSLALNQICGWDPLVTQTMSGAFCDVIGGTVTTVGAACNPNANPPTDCGPGLVCLGDNTCHQLCDTSGSHNCPTGQTCNPATFGTADTCDSQGNGCPTTEMCDTMSMSCFLVAPGPNMGGWCVAMPDAGGLTLRSVSRPLAWSHKDVKGINR